MSDCKNVNAELLHCVYENGQMGQDAIQQIQSVLPEDARNSPFAQALVRQREAYIDFLEEAKCKLTDLGEQPKDRQAFTKLMSAMGVKLSSLTDKSTSHLAEMMVQGSAMGIIDIRKKLNDIAPADVTDVGLGQRLLEMQERNVEEWKTYL